MKVNANTIRPGHVIEHDGNIGVLEESVRGKHAIVGLYNGSGNLGTRVDAESKLGLLSVVNRKSLGEKSSKTSGQAQRNKTQKLSQSFRKML